MKATPGSIRTAQASVSAATMLVALLAVASVGSTVGAATVRVDPSAVDRQSDTTKQVAAIAVAVARDLLGGEQLLTVLDQPARSIEAITAFGRSTIVSTQVTLHPTLSMHESLLNLPPPRC